ncbi:hypothetical protein [Sporisorium scitamineum]|uniref:Uncharacterized protein n=1 Tax=Sporisorium scitamineum TaxID=49012 RepID=A0A0F7RT89_9BASI|nr:hypothetical protein [Sporisorium scitamineum]
MSALLPHFHVFLNTAMPRPTFSKRSTASRMASAAEWDAKEARLQRATSKLAKGMFSSIQ